MEEIFNIQFSFEKYTKENIIEYFSTKQGGKYSVFSYHWQCFAWAAVVGFYYNQKKEVGSPKADKVFSLNTMRNNGGEKIVQALICMCIAKANSVNILKNPENAINLINEYANGGFYYIKKLIDNEEIFGANDLEKIKQEIFSREIV